MDEKEVTTCPACRGEMQSLGQIPLRVGGSGGGWHLIFGNLADVAETVLAFDVYRCQGCGRLEFYDHDFSLPSR